MTPIDCTDGLEIPVTVISDTINSKIDNSLIAPINTIVIYEGVFSDIPSGWALCDGNNGTPDLSNKFIQGSSLEEIGLIGGYSDVLIQHTHVCTIDENGLHTHIGSLNDSPSHTHDGSISFVDGGHTHNSFDTDYESQCPRTDGPWCQVCAKYDTDGIAIIDDDSPLTVTGGEHMHEFEMNTEGNHDHTMTLLESGLHNHDITIPTEGTSNSNLPPYYKLAFIMRIS